MLNEPRTTDDQDFEPMDAYGCAVMAASALHDAHDCMDEAAKALPLGERVHLQLSIAEAWRSLAVTFNGGGGSSQAITPARGDIVTLTPPAGSESAA